MGGKTLRFNGKQVVIMTELQLAEFYPGIKPNYSIISSKGPYFCSGRSGCDEDICKCEPCKSCKMITPG